MSDDSNGGFHVRHDLRPDLTFELLNLLSIRSAGQTHDDLTKEAAQNGFRLRNHKTYDKLLKSLIELDIVIKNDKYYRLTRKGEIIAKLILYQTDLLQDFIHFLYYSSYDVSNSKRFSWSYQQVCQSLWENAPYKIHSDRIVNYILQRAFTDFGVTSISFSTSSVAGILNWIEALNPSCIVAQSGERVFVRRETCSVELFALSLMHVFQFDQYSESTFKPITADHRERVCKLCLIATESFPDLLAQAELCFKNIQIRRERGDRLSITNFSWDILENR